MFAWVNLLQYFEYNKSMRFVLATIRNSSPVIMRTIVGVLPVYIGFTLLGLMVFSDSKRFSNFGDAFYNLFAIMNGDEIYSVFRDIDQINFLFACIYVYMYIAFSVWVLQNIFTVIIESGYMEGKYNSKFDWLKDQNEHKENEEEHFDVLSQGISEFSAKQPQP